MDSDAIWCLNNTSYVAIGVKIAVLGEGYLEFSCKVQSIILRKKYLNFVSPTIYSDTYWDVFDTQNMKGFRVDCLSKYKSWGLTELIVPRCRECQALGGTVNFKKKSRDSPSFLTYFKLIVDLYPHFDSFSVVKCTECKAFSKIYPQADIMHAFL